MSKHQLKARAEHLYIREGKGVTEISKMLGLSTSTVSRWKREGDWEARHKDVHTSLSRIAEKLIILLADEVDQMEALDNANVDKVTKAVKSITTLDKEVDMLGSTVLVMENYGNFLQQKYSGFFGKFQQTLPDFLIYMREKYKTQ
ncbi:MAG TPA: hypothetical protein ENJ29_02535 [Bacteroidetes bacterium]|nr:hypothetical protein [Bacteroidota bacterium]